MYLIKYSKIIILGSGPSGCTSGIYISRANLNPILITGKNLGGQLINTDIENWPGIIKINGFDLMNKIFNQLKFINIEIIYDSIYMVNYLKKTILNFGKFFLFFSDFLIIATGVKPRLLLLKNENKYINSNISFCGLCDGNFYKNKIIVIIGGGNSAIENAINLSNIVKKIILIHRNLNFKSECVLLKNLLNKKNLIFKLNFFVFEIIGDFKKIKYIKIKNLLNNILNIIYLDGIFLFIGNIPNNIFFLFQLLINNLGYISVKNNNFTNISGVFACGDIQNFNFKQAIISSGLGSICSLDLVNYYNFLNLINV